ncbi:Small RNA 2-O-methyltransferase [Striga hermonthica]|uniref:Small RNA 2'-O-methyltransferase n=1 Tax=Striga hermonthica TaxID=68872 RepID=A0A9N7RE65_STRHE|nr:Small RNA 2-O-methyltransferase [Striga hermonthica]
MAGTGKSPENPTKKAPLTPKAIINQKFGDKACYKIDEVQDSSGNGCPGLAISRKGPCLYRCTLHLPDATVVSDTFKRKKDAEQSAAEKAIETVLFCDIFFSAYGVFLGIRLAEYNPTVQEAWDDLGGRIAFMFANEFLSSLNPLSSHLRAVLRREGHQNGCLPVSVIATHDAKISNICKYITPAAEVNSLILKAAAKMTDLVLISDEKLSLKRKTSYPPEIIASLNHESSLSESIAVECIRIPASLGEAVHVLMLNIASTGYYLDVIARELCVADASNVLISRVIGKASSEVRIYSSSPPQLPPDELAEPKGSLNVRATYFAGEEVYADAILASVGYTWRSNDLFHEAVSLRSYYRMLINKIPSGIYQISRDAILAAKLPLTYTTKSNWRGSFPRDILFAFCRAHHLPEPVFSSQNTLNSSLDLPGSCKKLKVSHSGTGDSVESTGAFSCEIKIYSKNQNLILQCSPNESHKKPVDAMQSTSLKVLNWLDMFFEYPNISLEKLKLFADKLDISFTPDFFFEEFALCRKIHNFGIQACDYKAELAEPSFIEIGGENSGVTPSNGALACISYSVSLSVEGDCTREHLESCEEFEFEIGNEAVLPHLEAAVAQLAVGQSACFWVELFPTEFIIAAARDSVSTLSLLSSRSCKLEYSVTLLQVTEPMEDRMEQALFSPPLAKQRVEFAVQQIKESSAASLIDLGCGSGSLLDSLLSYPTSLEKIAGVDISKRALAKAAKSLHTKLTRLVDCKEPGCKIQSAVLYDGSITKIDSQLCGFDIATCLEVIEHMEEEDACLFGDIALESFCPKILIISTPNFEYNTILHNSTPPQGEEENPNEKNQPESFKFRNLDHKFEWTRAQFEHWACDLATRHNYSVEFSGVGGDGDVDPGFASQIAIFKRSADDDDDVAKIEVADNCVPIWKWSREEENLVSNEM